MKGKTMKLVNLLLAISLLCGVSVVSAEEHEVPESIEPTKAVFDFRMSDPKMAVLHLGLIRQTYDALATANKNPDLVVVFIGPSVKLISKSKEGVSQEDQKVLDLIAKTISDMSKDGIKLEVCLVAARIMNVDPASVLPEIKRVENGWIAEIEYQAQGYSLVPVY